MGGAHEYASPTYSAVALQNLYAGASAVSDPAVARRLAALAHAQQLLKDVIANGFCEKEDVGGYVPAVHLPGREPGHGGTVNVAHFANADAMLEPAGPDELRSWCAQRCAASAATPG